ncbi:hypothetical protein K5Q02_06535 [Pseudomonas sp. MM211]|uniref:hypothetical protein n=1 Tax=Pseudomonas sp. MM211 TaxID=2866808 RepID=UPI001CEDDC38|nr:hypothetical protein [Pseudomonas sp. MM211]UCJ18025.1 hypothetical protein K5Q02_06535 [Pseudomonas sp. MM211]
MQIFERGKKLGLRSGSSTDNVQPRPDDRDQQQGQDTQHTAQHKQWRWRAARTSLNTRIVGLLGVHPSLALFIFLYNTAILETQRCHMHDQHDGGSDL